MTGKSLQRTQNENRRAHCEYHRWEKIMSTMLSIVRVPSSTSLNAWNLQDVPFFRERGKDFFNISRKANGTESEEEENKGYNTAPISNPGSVN
jgi:hypothetical protein